MQDALSIKLWGPFFDDFVDISIFMILGSWGDPGQDWLDWQIWPSGRELGSQSQAPGSIPPAPLVGSNLCASRRRTLRGLFFTKNSVLKLGIVDFLDFNEKCQFLIILGVRRRRRRRHTWLSPSPHPITPRKKTRREAGILT